MEKDLVKLIRSRITKYGKETEEYDALAKEAYQKGETAAYHKLHRQYLLSRAKQDALMELLNQRSK